MKQGISNLIHEGLILKDLREKNGKGVFANQDFKKGDALFIFGGRAVTRETLELINPELLHYALQIGKNIFLMEEGQDDGSFVNHSCDPNLGFEGQVTLVAMRDIKVGEEVCFDYAMVDMSNADEFDCECGTKPCRGHVTGEDWRLPDLQRRYKGFFGAHVQRAIDSERGY